MEKNTPVKKFKAGSVSASVWRNTAVHDGKPAEYATISLQRVYKDKNGEWQHTATLRTGDLPKAMLVLGEAYKELSLA